MFIIFFFFWFPLFIFIFLFFTAWPTTRYPSPATRHPRPATRHPSPVTRHPRKSPAVRKQKLLRWYDSNLTVQIQFKSDDMSTFLVSHITFHNSRYRYAAVSCMERYEKMLKPFFLYFQNINCLFTVLSCEYKNRSLIYFLFDVCGLELPAINDAPVKQCILFRSFRFDGNS